MDPSMLAVAAVNIVAGYLARGGGEASEQVGDAAVEQAGNAVTRSAGELWRWLRDRMRGDQAASAAIERLNEAPEDPRRQGAVEFLLQQLVERDPEVAQQLAALVADVERDDPGAGTQIVESGAVALGGDVRMSGHAVAGRDMHIGTDAGVLKPPPADQS